MGDFYPKISIVTPSFNQGQYLEETINSVLSQNYPNLEYIIIDGGSTDNSVEIIKKYQEYLSYWVSEKDNGQAHAINKGLQYCTGEIFNWLNSDDYLEPEALFKIAAGFAEENVDLLAGKVRTFSKSEESIIQNQNLSSEGLMCWNPNVKFVQPGVWMRRKFIESCGGIDAKFQYAFDWDLYIRYLYHSKNVKEIDELLVHFRLHEASKTQSSLEKFASEERNIIEKIYESGDYPLLSNACLYKIQKTKWTHYLSELSKEDNSFYSKFIKTISNLHTFSKVSISRQTAGALKAFWEHREL